MLNYFISLLLATSLFAETNNNLYESKDLSIEGKFTEIREFSPLYFANDGLKKESKDYFEALIATVNSYKDNNQTIKIGVVGHSNARTNIYDRVIADEKAYKKTLKNSVVFAQKIVQRLIDNGIKLNTIDIDYKNSKNMGLLNSTKKQVNLSNHVIVTMYVVAPEDKAKIEAEIKAPEIAVVKVQKQALVKPEIQVVEVQKKAPVKPKIQVVKVQDRDSDGVLDTIDSEIQTPIGYTVDEQGKAISLTLQNSFAKGSLEVTKSVNEKISQFAEYLKKNPTVRAHIIGHNSRTDASDMIYNIRLSIKRAKEIKSVLVKHGIDAKRLTTDGRGFNAPIADSKTAEGRMKNRRIEIIIKRKKSKEL